jgi:hypothetical protein
MAGTIRLWFGDDLLRLRTFEVVGTNQIFALHKYFIRQYESFVKRQPRGGECEKASEKEKPLRKIEYG